jgi:hypothetical protein
MTVLMACVRCDTTVENPRVMNYILEMCNPCVLKHKEQADRAIDTYLDGIREQELQQ